MSPRFEPSELPAAFADLELPRWAWLKWEIEAPSGEGYRQSGREPAERATLMLRWRLGWGTLFGGALGCAVGLAMIRVEGDHALPVVAGWGLLIFGALFLLLGPYRLLQRTQLSFDGEGLARTHGPLAPRSAERLSWSEIGEVSTLSRGEADTWDVVVGRRGVGTVTLQGHILHDEDAKAVKRAVERLAEHFAGVDDD